MQGDRKKLIIKRISITLIVVLFLALIIPVPMYHVYDAIEIKLDDPSYYVLCQVKVRGKYHWNLLSKDVFDGQIIVSKYKLTNEKMSKVYFSDEGWPLEYSYDAGLDNKGRTNRETFFLGRLHSNPWFRQMVITVYSDNPTNTDGGGKSKGNWGTWNECNGYCNVPQD